MQYAKQQAVQFSRLRDGSLDPDNKKKYADKADEWEKVVEKYGISGTIEVGNKAKAIDSMITDVSDDVIRYTREEILEEMQQSPIGKRVIRQISDSDVSINLINKEQITSNRGEQLGETIIVYLQNCKNTKVVAQTVIHEMTHYFYHIGSSQHAEAVCFAMEKMHLLKRDFLTVEEWNQMVQLAKDNYRELEWESGGYGNFKQFDFVRRTIK